MNQLLGRANNLGVKSYYLGRYIEFLSSKKVKSLLYHKKYDWKGEKNRRVNEGSTNIFDDIFTKIYTFTF